MGILIKVSFINGIEHRAKALENNLEIGDVNVKWLSLSS
jgi:hypothetical protein